MEPYLAVQMAVYLVQQMAFWKVLLKAPLMVDQMARLMAD